MKKKMNAVINSITGTDFETLKNIISLQYRKFIRFYRLIEEYVNDIDSIQYNFTSSDSLNLSCKFNDNDCAKEASSFIKTVMKSNGYDGKVSIKKDILNISLILKEEENCDESQVSESTLSDNSGE